MERKGNREKSRWVKEKSYVENCGDTMHHKQKSGKHQRFYLIILILFNIQLISFFLYLHSFLTSRVLCKQTFNVAFLCFFVLFCFFIASVALHKCPPGILWLKPRMLAIMGPFLSRLPLEEVKTIPKEAVSVCDMICKPISELGIVPWYLCQIQ